MSNGLLGLFLTEMTRPGTTDTEKLNARAGSILEQRIQGLGLILNGPFQ